MALNRKNRQQIINWMLPYVGLPTERQTFVTSTFLGSNPIRDRIAYEGDAIEFATLLVDKVDRYGTQNDVLALLDTLKSYVNAEQAIEIEGLKQEIIDSNTVSSLQPVPSRNNTRMTYFVVIGVIVVIGVVSLILSMGSRSEPPTMTEAAFIPEPTNTDDPPSTVEVITENFVPPTKPPDQSQQVQIIRGADSFAIFSSSDISEYEVHFSNFRYSLSETVPNTWYCLLIEQPIYPVSEQCDVGIIGTIDRDFSTENAWQQNSLELHLAGNLIGTCEDVTLDGVVPCNLSLTSSE